MTPVIRLTASQLAILLSAFRARSASRPYRHWPEYRGYIALAKRGLLRLRLSNGVGADEWDEFRITPAGRARVHAALGGAR